MSTADRPAPAPRPSLGRWPLRPALLAIGVLLVGTAAWIGVRPHAADLASPGVHAGALEAAGKAAGLVAAMLLMLQFVLSARFRLLDEAFSVGRLLRFHAAVGAAAALLAALHPMLLYASPAVRPLGPLRASIWPELVGGAALAVLGIVVCTSVYRAFLGLSYEAWRRVHLLTFVAVGLATVHALVRGGDLREGWPLAFWGAVLAGYLVAFLWVKVIRPLALLDSRCEVAAVTRVSHDTHTLELKPPGGKPFRYLPGQFVFLKLRRRGRRTETHPFTLSSSPSRPETIAVTIKACGDFTATIGQTQVGDTAIVDGPYGHFSYRLHGGNDLLLIAGGIGITPMLSMVRDIADNGGEQCVTLIWANRTEADAVFRDELDQMAAELPSLRVHHVLSRQDGWHGETGHIDAAMLTRLLTDRDRKARVFLCGPPPMMKSIAAALRRAGIPRRRIHTEAFSL